MQSAVPSDLEIPQPSYRDFRRSGVDPATRRLALIAGGLGGALILLVGGWMVLGQHHAGVPLIMADARPIRVKPANPGGMQVVGANEDVMASSAAGDGDAVAPAPEAPQVQALQAEIQAAKQAETAPPPAAAPAPAAPPAAAAATIPPAPAPSPALAAAPPAMPVPHAAPKPDGKSGGMQVQLGALASEQAAKTEWERLSRRVPGLLNGRQPTIARAEVDGRTVYRLRAGGFADMAAASEFCAQLRAKGDGCSIASF